MLLFVYGTLKQGHGNNIILEGDSFLEEVKSPPAFSMIDLGGIPGLVEGNHSIIGEIYDVADITSCDHLEGHPDFYCRKPYKFEGYEEDVWVYTINEQWHDGNAISSNIGWRDGAAVWR